METLSTPASAETSSTTDAEKAANPPAVGGKTAPGNKPGGKAVKSMLDSLGAPPPPVASGFPDLADPKVAAFLQGKAPEVEKAVPGLAVAPPAALAPPEAGTETSPVSAPTAEPKKKAPKERREEKRTQEPAAPSSSAQSYIGARVEASQANAVSVAAAMQKAKGLKPDTVGGIMSMALRDWLRRTGYPTDIHPNDDISVTQDES